MKSHLYNIIVGISGGVDSAVSAYLLKQAGHNVRGIFMKNWDADETDERCPATQDFMDAQNVCDQIGIDLQLVNFATEYWQDVFTHFLREYQSGRTPNPDVLCNKEIKFKAFLDYAKQQGADYIATGHYARICNNQLLKAVDDAKDQSYFLYLLTQQQLSQSVFPLGGMYKKQVREIARQIGLTNAAKKDSTGICFIGERKFQQFLSDFIPAKPGNIETLEGEIMGTHAGVMFYTIGQRQGLKIGGRTGKKEAPWYIVKKDVIRNTLIVVQGDHPIQYRNSLDVIELHWVNHQPPLHNRSVLRAKIRYRQPEQTCTLQFTEKNAAKVFFDYPQRSIAPGQSIVFYEGDICLGGGIIDN